MSASLVRRHCPSQLTTSGVKSRRTAQQKNRVLYDSDVTELTLLVTKCKTQGFSSDRLIVKQLNQRYVTSDFDFDFDMNSLNERRWRQCSKDMPSCTADSRKTGLQIPPASVRF